MHITLSYIDPGSGSLILQLILAGTFGTLITFRKFVAFPFRWLFSKRKRKQKSSNKHEF